MGSETKLDPAGSYFINNNDTEIFFFFFKLMTIFIFEWTIITLSLSLFLICSSLKITLNENWPLFTLLIHISYSLHSVLCTIFKYNFTFQMT